MLLSRGQAWLATVLPALGLVCLAAHILIFSSLKSLRRSIQAQNLLSLGQYQMSV